MGRKEPIGGMGPETGQGSPADVVLGLERVLGARGAPLTTEMFAIGRAGGNDSVISVDMLQIPRARLCCTGLVGASSFNAEQLYFVACALLHSSGFRACNRAPIVLPNVLSSSSVSSQFAADFSMDRTF